MNTETNSGQYHCRQLLSYLRQHYPELSNDVLNALAAVPRHQLAPNLSLFDAYSDQARPIGLDQTISQPSLVAQMTQFLSLSGQEKVLEIGTGSGYQTAILSQLAHEVYTVERLEILTKQSQQRLQNMGFQNIHYRVGDGFQGWSEKAPFERIILTAAPAVLPRILLAQLAEGGIMIAPVGPEHGVQELLRVHKREGQIQVERLGGVLFVPMLPGLESID